MTDINRRQLLGAAGAAGLLASFPAIARALAIPASVKSGTLQDVEHVVILMQENRSFDHYFGTLPGVRGFSDPYPAPGALTDDDRGVFTQLNQRHPGPDRVTPFPLNVRQTFAHMRVEGTPHSWPDAQAAWDHGRMARWPEAKQLHAMGYFQRADIPFQFALAEAFTLCDAYHCSFHGGTNPNRLFLWSGTNDGAARAGGPAIGNSHDRLPADGGAPVPYTWTTYVERLQQAGIDWCIYQDMADNFTDNPLVGFAAFQASVAGAPGSDPELARRGLKTRALDQLRADAQSDSLPAVSWIVATAAGSEHPGPSSPAQGAAYTAEILDALTARPEVWSKTVLLIMFDENDGFFDHMPPPAPPSRLGETPLRFAGHSQVSTEGEYHLHHSAADAELEREAYRGRPYGLGPRVPAYVISPWSRGGYINSEVLDHTSVIRFLEARFGVHEPNISPWRRAVCGDFLNAFDFAQPNRSHLPAFPDPRGDAKQAARLPGRTTPPLPARPTQAVQEAGLRPQRPNRYDLDLGVSTGAGEAIALTLVNHSARAAVFQVYDRGDPAALPRRYTIDRNNRFQDSWPCHDGHYDLQIMGPEGFHRRLRGHSSEAGDGEPVTLELAGNRCHLLATAEGYSVRFNNHSGVEQTLSAGARVAVPLDANARYDLQVRSARSADYLREYAGRLPAEDSASQA